MKKNIGITSIIIVLLSVAIVVMAFGFAQFSQTLTINGTAKVEATEWKVEFDTDTYKATANNTATLPDPTTLNGTSIVYNATLAKPGDVLEFEVNVKNFGQFAAELNTLTMSSVSSYSKYLSYTVNYDGTDYTTSATSIGNALAVGASKKVIVTVKYLMPADDADLPTEDVNVNLTLSLGYDQVL